MKQNKLTIALAGNPNSGKTTIFNLLTGSRQHVGNYPGVTVERKEGLIKIDNNMIKVIDLPGTYSLTAYSPDELVARNVIIDEQPDLVVNIVDASNLERNLYLTMQLKELEIPMILAVNMVDHAEANGISIDYKLLSRLLGIPVVRLVGTTGEGIDELIKAIPSSITKTPSLKRVTYDMEIEKAIADTEKYLTVDKETAAALSADERLTGFNKYPSRWLAIKLLENDKDVVKELRTSDINPVLLERAQTIRRMLESILGEDPEGLIAEGRYAYIRGAFKEVVQVKQIDKISVTEKIDQILLNRVIGLPLFLLVMWGLFHLTFTAAAPVMEWLEILISAIGTTVNAALADGLLKSLLVDGIIAGVGGVIIFLPNILLLFLGIAILEASGYMSRAAFLMDKIMHKVGLHGKSFVPMLIGFGCSIPAIMATRTLENPKDRLVTTLVTPLISCGARLPVYTLLIAAFFTPDMAGTILFSLYLTGIMLALIMAKVFKTWLLPGEAEPFIMELPVYRMPKLKSVILQMWERAWLYLKKAGTIILAISILMWALFSFPMTDINGNEYSTASEKMQNSYAGRLGKTIEPVIAPLGFDWKTGIALVAGFAAKEVVVSTMGTLYSMEDEDGLLEGEESQIKSFAQLTREQSGFTPLTAYVLMLFILIYVPCMATIAIIKRETNSWKWPGFTIGYTLVLAWTICFVVYQGGKMLGIGI